MSTTPLYDLETIEYNTTGWNGIVTANMQKMEAHLHSRFLVTLGESVAVRDAIYIKPEDGKAYKAQTTEAGDKQPALGLAVDVGDADEEIRVQRVGLVDFGSGLTPGRLYYLSQTTAGGLTAAMDVAVADEAFTAVLQSYVTLAHTAITPESETVTSVDGTTTYSRGTDYEMDYDPGRIIVFSAGSMEAEGYLIDYDYSPIGARPQLMGYAVSASHLFLSVGLTDFALLHVEGNEQVGGVKTFTSLPRVASYRVPTDNEEFVTKKYVDDAAGAQTNATIIAGVPVDANDLGDGKILKYNATSGKLEYESLPGGSDAGSVLGVPVNDAGKTDGYVLKYDAATQTLKYQPDDGSEGSGVSDAQAKKYAIIFG
jgi:hypothetical protein